MARIGRSPAKDAASAFRPGLWRIVVPIHIPQITDDYFAGQLEAFHHCIGSITSTSSRNALTTIVADGCDSEALKVIEQVASCHGVDQLLVNRQNRGKVGAILGAARGSHEPYIVFLDGDSILLPGWHKAVAGIFDAHPCTGVVSLMPNPATTGYCTSSTVVGGLLRGRLGLKKGTISFDLVVRHHEQIQRPAGIPWSYEFFQVVIQRADHCVQVGGLHFAQVVSREALRVCHFYPLETALGGKTVTVAIDQPIDEAGFWRLAPNRPYAWHLGNSVTDEDLPESIRKIETHPTDVVGYPECRDGRNGVSAPSGRPDALARVFPYPMRVGLKRAVIGLLRRRAASCGSRIAAQ